MKATTPQDDLATPLAQGKSDRVPGVPRQLSSHLACEGAMPLAITVVDLPGIGGASQRYDVTGYNAGRNPSSGRKHAEHQLAEAYAGDNVELRAYYRNLLNQQDALSILFQNGHPDTAGVNGITMEVLLAVCIDRLQGFQAGPFPNEHNEAALVYLRSALEALHQRTRANLQERSA